MGPFLVLAFHSFLMKADLGKAGLIPLILRRQQQSHNRNIQAISRTQQPRVPYRASHPHSKRLLTAAPIGNSRIVTASIPLGEPSVPGRPSAFKMAPGSSTHRQQPNRSSQHPASRAERTGPPIHTQMVSESRAYRAAHPHPKWSPTAENRNSGRVF
jgi:hypothetical protein